MNKFFTIVFLIMSQISNADKLSLTEAETLHKYLLETSHQNGFLVQYEGFLTRKTTTTGLWSHNKGSWHFSKGKYSFKMLIAKNEKNADFSISVGNEILFFSLKSSQDITKKMPAKMLKEVVGMSLDLFKKSLEKAINKENN